MEAADAAPRWRSGLRPPVGLSRPCRRRQNSDTVLRFNRQIERHNKSSVLLIFHKESEPSCCLFPHGNIPSIPPDPLSSIATSFSRGPAEPVAPAREVFLFSSSFFWCRRGGDAGPTHLLKADSLKNQLVLLRLRNCLRKRENAAYVDSTSHQGH